MNQIKIHSQQLVAEALSYMHNGKVDVLPVYDKGLFIGKITYEELMIFLNHNEKSGNIHAHKMNFDIGTAMLVIKRTNDEFYNSGIERSSFSKQLLVGLSSVAVVSMILMGMTRMFFNQNSAISVDKNSLSTKASDEIRLTLVNGKSITLSEAKNGLIIDGSKLNYSDGSQIDYQNLLAPSDGHSPYYSKLEKLSAYRQQMVLNVPTGGIYRITLPDGSKVWLNASSSLRFPATFEGDTKRRVELNGEAYFEIEKATFKSNLKGAEEQKMPFIVVTNNQEIEVLGTHFNVSAYQNEKSVKTTLIEGSIRLRSSLQINKLPGTLDPSSLDPMQVENNKRNYGEAILLKPNQEATLTAGHIAVKEVDANEAFAWTDGEYIFRNTSLETVMHTITRWYDMEVVYKHKEAEQTLLGGTISRSQKIEEVLKMLELTANVHFKIEGKKITVIE